MACLKFLAQCPYPRCLIQIFHIWVWNPIGRIGWSLKELTTKDFTTTLISFDNGSSLMALVSQVQLLTVFCSQNLLYLPEYISLFIRIWWICIMKLVYRTHFRCDFLTMNSTFISCMFQISCMSLNLGYGRHFSHISCESYMYTEMKLFQPWILSMSKISFLVLRLS